MKVIYKGDVLEDKVIEYSGIGKDPRDWVEGESLWAKLVFQGDSRHLKLIVIFHKCFNVPSIECTKNRGKD